MKRRLTAVIALVAIVATIALAVAVAVSEFPRGLGLLACVVVAGAAAWYGVLRRGPARVAGLAVAALALAGAVALLVADDSSLDELLVVVGLLIALAASRAAVGMHVDLPDASAPERRGALLQSARRVAARRSASRSPTRHAREGSSRSS